jgi:release factor glutamine methyltransferase
VRLVTLPGVFRPISDSRLLAAVLREHVAPGATVLDLCTGSGALAVCAARAAPATSPPSTCPAAPS